MRLSIVILFILSVFMLFGNLTAQTVEVNGVSFSTNTEVTPANVMEEVQEVREVVSQWQSFVKSVKGKSWSITTISALIALIFLSVMLLGVSLCMGINVAIGFTPPAVDVKLEKAEKWIKVYMIKYPYNILKFLKGKFVKK